ncbi:hypothetical protein BJX70DRAFT_307184 [Aspergillus crustosus]
MLPFNSVSLVSVLIGPVAAICCFCRAFYLGGTVGSAALIAPEFQPTLSGWEGEWPPIDSDVPVENGWAGHILMLTGYMA